MPNIPAVRPRTGTGQQKVIEEPKSNTGLLVGGGLVVAAAAAGAWFMFGNKKAEVAAPAAAAAVAPVAAESGWVKFAGVPAGATITINDQPFEGDSAYLPIGQDFKYMVKAPGYKPAQNYGKAIKGLTNSIQVIIEKEAAAAPPPKPGPSAPAPRPQAAVVEAPAAPAGEGTLTVAADPVFATISVDGAALGSGRVIGAKVKAGNHTVRISADGYETKSISISVQANTPVSLGKVTLTKTGGP